MHASLLLLYHSISRWVAIVSVVLLATCGGEAAEEALIEPTAVPAATRAAASPTPEQRPIDATATSVQPAVLPGNVGIGFLSLRDGDWDVYLMRPDGRDVVNITRNDVGDEEVAWSPDGARVAVVQRGTVRVDVTPGVVIISVPTGAVEARIDGYLQSPVWSLDGQWIAFLSDQDGSTELEIVRVDGTERRRLTDSSSTEFNPAWSPDGTKLAVERDGGIVVVDADGSGERLLVEVGAGPAWSPDGSAIAFARLGRAEIFVVSADGSGETKVADSGEGPVWSPDGTRIAYRSFRDSVHIVNADGSGTPVSIGAPGMVDALDDTIITPNPVWSPDGGFLLFSAERDDDSDVFIARADGTQVVNVTDDLSHDIAVAWVPLPADFGSAPAAATGRIAYLANADGTLHVVNADGSNDVQATNRPAGVPVWSPDGTLIALELDGQIRVLGPDGNVILRLTNSPSRTGKWGLAWSPDGTTILFNSDGDIHVAHLNSGPEVNLTDHPAADFLASWSPDGTKIAFLSDRDVPGGGGDEGGTIGDVFVMNADGSNPVNLTRSPNVYGQPQWVPDGRQLVLLSPLPVVSTSLRSTWTPAA